MEDKNKKQRKTRQKLHGNEKPLKIDMSFDKAMKKIAKKEPPKK